jgi:hypothetical protein|tara:strand:- start:738 stop:1355 length:618 start_codon:yes stop_codon:yes gene_type:complete
MNFIKGVKAKIRNKKKMPSWYTERLIICNQCSENSKNKAKIPIKDKIRISHNFGKDACLICSCGINDLTSDPTVKCSAKSPKWDWIQVPNFDIKFNLENYSPSIGSLTREGKYYFYDFSSIKFKNDATAVLLFVSKKELDSFKVISSCGCTMPEFSRNEKGYLINVSYDTKIIGDFEKQVSISYLKENKEKEYLTFWIKGCVLDF